MLMSYFLYILSLIYGQDVTTNAEKTEANNNQSQVVKQLLPSHKCHQTGFNGGRDGCNGGGTGQRSKGRGRK